MVLEAAGGATLTYDEFIQRAGTGDISAGWIVGGYPTAWVDKDFVKATGKIELLVAQDMFPSDLTAAATIVLPAAAWVERDGSFVNSAGLIQPFTRAISGPDGARPDGRWLYALAGYEGLYSGERVRELMAATMPAFAEVCEAPAKPAHAH